MPYATKALMDAAPGTRVGQHATVYADGTAAYIGDYRWNGSAWKVFLEDTAWATLAVTSPVAHESGNPLQYRRLNGVVFFRGRANASEVSPIGTLPPGFRPDGQSGEPNIFIGDSGYYARLNIPTSTGTITPTSPISNALSLPFTFIAAPQ